MMGNYGVSWVGLVSGSQRNQLSAEINGSGGEPLIKITLNSVGFSLLISTAGPTSVHLRGDTDK